MDPISTGTIAYLYDSQHTPRIHVAAAAAAHERARQLGHAITPIDIQERSNPIDLKEQLVADGFRGLLIGFHDHVNAVLAIDWHPLAVTCMGFLQDLPRYHGVCKDNHNAVLTAWREIRAAGYNRVGAILHQHFPAIHDDTVRLRACLEAQIDHEADFIPPFCTTFASHDGLEAWIERHRPEAILGFSVADREALRHCGHDLPFASLHVHGGHPSYDNIAGCLVNIEEQAERAVDKLAELIDFDLRGCPDHPRVDYLPMRWQRGMSLFPAAG